MIKRIQGAAPGFGRNAMRDAEILMDEAKRLGLEDPHEIARLSFKLAAQPVNPCRAAQNPLLENDLPEELFDPGRVVLQRSDRC